jgi:hypothetical protein
MARFDVWHNTHRAGAGNRPETGNFDRHNSRDFNGLRSGDLRLGPSGMTQKIYRQSCH